jgi:VIT1/CCC1 family predicted Fe2+/Mn2+ transporter
MRALEENWLKSGLEMLVIGGAAAGVSYVVGFFLKEFHFEDIVQ